MLKIKQAGFIVPKIINLYRLKTWLGEFTAFYKGRLLTGSMLPCTMVV